METLGSVLDNRSFITQACANYDVLRVASAGCNSEMAGVPLPTRAENITALLSHQGGPHSMYRQPGDISFRQETKADDLERALQQCSTSLGIDLSECYAANSEQVLGLAQSAFFRKAALIEGLALDVAAMKPQKPGQVLFATATSLFRTKDSACALDSNGAEWSIIPDDSFMSVAFAPGEESALVLAIMQLGEYSQRGPESARLADACNRIKSWMLVVTNPVSRDLELVDWHSYKLLGLFMREVRALEKKGLRGVVRFLAKTGNDVFRFDTTGSTPEYSSQLIHHGFLRQVILALEGNESTGRFEASVAALKTADHEGAFAAWNVLMAVRTFVEALNCGTENPANILKYSRAVNDYIMDYEESDVEFLANVMAVSDDERRYLIERTVEVEHQVIDLDLVGARNEEGCDHDKQGSLNRPKLPGKKKVAGCNVQGGRGMGIMSASPHMSYRCRGSRYKITVESGKLKFSKRSDLIEDLNFFRKIKSVQVGLDGIALEKEETVPDERFIDDQIINALLRGMHGYNQARWIWSLILLGTIAVDTESTNLSYVFGADLKIDDASGYRVRTFMTSVCLTRAVTYTDGRILWLDAMDNVQLRKLKKTTDGWLQIKDEVSPVHGIDVGALWECSIMSKLCVGR